MLEQSIDFLSQRYDVHSSGERGSQSSGYHSPGNFSSRNGSFRSDTGVSEWYPLGRGDLGVGFPAHPGKEVHGVRCIDTLRYGRQMCVRAYVCT